MCRSSFFRSFKVSITIQARRVESNSAEIRHEPIWTASIRAQAGCERQHGFWLARNRCRTTPSSAECQMGRGFIREAGISCGNAHVDTLAPRPTEQRIGIICPSFPCFTHGLNCCGTHQNAAQRPDRANDVGPPRLAANSGAGCMAVPEARAALAAIGTETIGTAATQKSTRQSFSPSDSLFWSRRS